MKKVIKLQSKLLKEISFIYICCYENGYGSTYKNKLKVLFFSSNGIIETVYYKYSLKNIYLLLDTVFLPIKFDNRVKNNLINKNLKRI